MTPRNQAAPSEPQRPRLVFLNEDGEEEEYSEVEHVQFPDYEDDDEEDDWSETDWIHPDDYYDDADSGIYQYVHTRHHDSDDDEDDDDDARRMPLWNAILMHMVMGRM